MVVYGCGVIKTPNNQIGYKGVALVTGMLMGMVMAVLCFMMGGGGRVPVHSIVRLLPNIYSRTASITDITFLFDHNQPITTIIVQKIYTLTLTIKIYSIILHYTITRIITASLFFLIW